MRKLIEIISKRIKGNDYILDSNIPFLYLMSFALNRFFMLIRGKFKILGIHKKGKNIFIGKNVVFKCKRFISMGNNVTINDNVYIDALSLHGINIGNGSSIGSNSIIRCSGNLHSLGMGFEMGSNSSLADGCFIGATGGVWIGNDVICGQNIRFHSSNHIFNDINTLIRKQGIVAKGIHVGNNCWIGAGTVFCDGVTLGDGCVVGANTVVTKSFSSNSIIVGSPAKQIGTRGLNYEFEK